MRRPDRGDARPHGGAKRDEDRRQGIYHSAQGGWCWKRLIPEKGKRRSPCAHQAAMDGTSRKDEY